MVKRSGEYFQKGEYHKNLDTNWPFYPVYLEKMRMVNQFLECHGKGKKILDLGCGEGVLVDKFREQNYDIIGIDLNYESEFILKRDIINTGFEENSFDVVLCLDVLEHLAFDEQEMALGEIKRILKPDGKLVITVPNLAHLASRFTYFFLGRLIRTAEDMKRHKGDRTIIEYTKLFKSFNYLIIKRKGIFPTFPLFFLISYYFPSKFVFWHKFLNKFFAYPNWCFLNFIICQNKKDG